MLARQPWTGGDEQSAPFRHCTQSRQTFVHLCPSFFYLLFVCGAEENWPQKSEIRQWYAAGLRVGATRWYHIARHILSFLTGLVLTGRPRTIFSSIQAGSPAVLTTGNSQFLGCNRQSQRLNDPSIPWATKLGNIWRYLKRLAYRCEPLLGAKGELVGA